MLEQQGGGRACSQNGGAGHSRTLSSVREYRSALQCGRQHNNQDDTEASRVHTTPGQLAEQSFRLAALRAAAPRLGGRRGPLLRRAPRVCHVKPPAPDGKRDGKGCCCGAPSKQNRAGPGLQEEPAAAGVWAGRGECRRERTAAATARARTRHAPAPGTDAPAVTCHTQTQWRAVDSQWRAVAPCRCKAFVLSRGVRATLVASNNDRTPAVTSG